MLNFYRIFPILLLSSCAAIHSENQPTTGATNEAGACIDREAISVAPMKVDLETAATAVIARCSAYTEATRRELISRFPGYRDYMAPKLRELDEAYMERARRAVAIARTQ